MTNVTAIIVSYNTMSLLKKCYESIRRFYPYMHCIIVDGSERNNQCYYYAKSLSQRINTTISVGKNIGHGPGMVLGIKYVKTDFFLLIDSDVIIQEANVIEKMIECYNERNARTINGMDGSENCFGIGQKILINKKGFNDPDGFPYLHPHFALINKKIYQKYPRFIHHGAPCIDTMRAIFERQLHTIEDFPVENYILHKGRGTRMLNPREFLPRNWDKYEA